MAKSVKTQNSQRGRNPIDMAYQNKIWEFMVDFGLERKPGKVHELLQEWATTQQAKQASLPPLFKEAKWESPPSRKTVQRYVEQFRENPPMSPFKHKRFQFPDDMEHIGWEHSRTALDCLRYYLSEYDVRPPVGLVQWFCRMAVARQSDLSDYTTASPELFQIGVYAEVCWFRDLVRAMGKAVPPATKMELALAWKFWETGEYDPSFVDIAKAHGIRPDAQLIDIRKEQLRLVTEMPIFLSYLLR